MPTMPDIALSWRRDRAVEEEKEDLLFFLELPIENDLKDLFNGAFPVEARV
jgi:hypothetical protein